MKKIDDSFFPASIIIPNNIDFSKNIGTQLLTTLFPDYELFWGLSIGTVDGFLIKTENEVSFNGKKYNIPHYLQPNEISIGMLITFKKRNKND